MNLRLTAACAATLALSGCGLAPYRPTPGEATAIIDVRNVPAPLICNSQGQRFSLTPDKDHKARIPAGAPLMLGSVKQIYGYNVTWTCMPTIGLTPEPNQSYYGVVESANQACRYEVYRAGADNRVGLALEPTLDTGRCPAR